MSVVVAINVCVVGAGLLNKMPLMVPVAVMESSPVIESKTRGKPSSEAVSPVMAMSELLPVTVIGCSAFRPDKG